MTRTVLRPAACLGFTLALSLFAGAPPAGAEKPPDRSPGLKPLERLVGTWREESVSRPAAWTPREERETQTVQSEWVLEGAYLQMKEKGKESEAIQLITFDPDKKVFRRWRFTSGRTLTESTGRWDEKSGTWTWTADMGEGVTLRSTWRVVDANTMEGTAVATDGAGKVYLDLRSKTTRVK